MRFSHAVRQLGIRKRLQVKYIARVYWRHCIIKLVLPVLFYQICGGDAISLEVGCHKDAKEEESHNTDDGVVEQWFPGGPGQGRGALGEQVGRNGGLERVVDGWPQAGV